MASPWSKYTVEQKTKAVTKSVFFNFRRRRMIDILKIAMGGCVDCSYKTNPCALDFDHKPGSTKLFNISSGSGLSWARLFTEMAKCDLVCANCHRIRTHLRRTKTRCFTAAFVDGRTRKRGI